LERLHGIEKELFGRQGTELCSPHNSIIVKMNKTDFLLIILEMVVVSLPVWLFFEVPIRGGIALVFP